MTEANWWAKRGAKQEYVSAHVSERHGCMSFEDRWTCREWVRSELRGAVANVRACEELLKSFSDEEKEAPTVSGCWISTLEVRRHHHKHIVTTLSGWKDTAVRYARRLAELTITCA